MQKTKVGEMIRRRSITEKHVEITFEGRTLVPGLSRFDVKRTHAAEAITHGRWIASKDGQPIGTLVDAGADQDGRDLYNLTLFRRDGACLLACVEVQPDIFAIHLRPEDQACLDGVADDGGAI